MTPESQTRRPFGPEFLAIAILSPLFGLGHLLAVCIESPVQNVLAFPLLLLAARLSPQDPGSFKIALLLNSGIWGIGLAWLIVRFVRLIVRRIRRKNSAVAANAG